MDEAAEKLGDRPGGIRLRNAKCAGDIAALGLTLESSYLDDCLLQGAARFGWDEKQAALRPSGRAGTRARHPSPAPRRRRLPKPRVRRGIGMCTMSHCTGRRAALPGALQRPGQVQRGRLGRPDRAPGPGGQPHLGRAHPDLRRGAGHPGRGRHHRHRRHRRHPVRVRLRREPLHVRDRRRHHARRPPGQGAAAGARGRDAGGPHGGPGHQGPPRLRQAATPGGVARSATSATTPSTPSAGTP